MAMADSPMVVAVQRSGKPRRRRRWKAARAAAHCPTPSFSDCSTAIAFRTFLDRIEELSLYKTKTRRQQVTHISVDQEKYFGTEGILCLDPEPPLPFTTSYISKLK